MSSVGPIGKPICLAVCVLLVVLCIAVVEHGSTSPWRIPYRKEDFVLRRPSVARHHGVPPILYMVKTARKNSDRVHLQLRLWASEVRDSVIFSSDESLVGVDPQIQCVSPLPLSKIGQRFLGSVEPVRLNNARSCLTSLVSLKTILTDSKWRSVDWLVVADDDTFVSTAKVKRFLSQFDARQLHFIGFAFGQPFGTQRHGQQRGQTYLTMSSSSAFAYSAGLLNALRANVTSILSTEEILALCRDALMADDIALSFLALDRQGVYVTERKGVKADFFRMSETNYSSAMTIHLPQRHPEWKKAIDKLTMLKTAGKL